LLYFYLKIYTIIMDAIQEKLAAWLPENLIEQLRSQITAAAPNSQPWVLEVSIAR
jgi:hypothetical protein